MLIPAWKDHREVCGPSCRAAVIMRSHRVLAAEVAGLMPYKYLDAPGKGRAQRTVHPAAWLGRV